MKSQKQKIMSEVCCVFEESKDSLTKYPHSNSSEFSTAATNNVNSRTKSVSFSNLEVKYFKFDLGDSLGVRADDGPPLTISWDSFKDIIIPISLYESVREPRGPVPIINSEERMKILLRNGVDISQIEDTMGKIRRRNEEQTLEHLIPTKSKRKMMNYMKKLVRRHPRKSGELQ